MDKPMTYVILVGEYADELARLVNDHLQRGALPLGGVATSHQHVHGGLREYLFAQALLVPGDVP